MKCPDCGSEFLEYALEPPHSPFTTLAAAVDRAEKGDVIGQDTTCWECGWSEVRRLRVEQIETETGDQETIERSQIQREIEDVIEDIDSLKALRDALAEVDRVRRLHRHVPPDDE